jgi:hypothetical protein
VLAPRDCTQLDRVNEFGVSPATYHVRGGNGMTIRRVALTFRHQEGDRTVLMQIVIVTVVAVVFLVRLAVALYDRPSRTPNQDR